MTMAAPLFRRPAQRGVALVEFTLVLPLLLLLLFGITEFARAMFEYDSLVKATRGAARYLTTAAPGDAAARALATCLAVYAQTDPGGQVTCSGTPLAPGLDASMVRICDSADASACPGDGSYALAGGIDLVAVKIVGYTFDTAVDFQLFGWQFGLPAISFAPISTTMRQ
ncbi:TadE-like protein [mine drainage metagenome]|jgi:hypothetical protein|uniref:TadE-like protein n=1 Tax=mine drainage metagenome TaxID=410659 RepID=A0A1J5QN58_9ZZZZ